MLLYAAFKWKHLKGYSHGPKQHLLADYLGVNDRMSVQYKSIAAVNKKYIE